MSNETLGFIGLGVMGEPMCHNLHKKSGRTVIAYDIDPAPLARLAADGVTAVDAPAELCAKAHTILLSLPDGDQVRRVCLGEQGLLAHTSAGQCVIDAGTSPPQLARELHEVFGAKDVAFARQSLKAPSLEEGGSRADTVEEDTRASSAVEEGKRDCLTVDEKDGAQGDEERDGACAVEEGAQDDAEIPQRFAESVSMR